MKIASWPDTRLIKVQFDRVLLNVVFIAEYNNTKRANDSLLVSKLNIETPSTRWFGAILAAETCEVVVNVTPT